MKRTARMLLLILLAAMLLNTAACAEEAVLLWEARNISPINDCTTAVIARPANQDYGVFSLDGRTIIPCNYSDIDAFGSAFGYYMVSTGSGINHYSLVDSSNKELTSDTYGDIEILDKNWFVGIKLKVTTDEDYDYRAFWTSDKYIISSYDVYYLPAGGKVGSLTRSEFRYAKVHGDHLLVEDRSDAVQLYNSRLTPVSSAFTELSDYAYYVPAAGLGKKYVTSRITGEKLFSGYSDVHYFFNEEALEVYSDIEGGTGLIDLNGNTLIPCHYGTYIDNYCYHSRYIKVKQKNLYGLYDLEQKEFILPCEYSDILTPLNEQIDYNGYFLVEKNGKVGYVDASNNVTCPIAYAKSAMTVLGCSMFAADLDGTYKLIAADGVITPLAGVTEVHAYSGPENGRYIKVKNSDGLWGIMDWHGNLVVDYLSSSHYNFNFVDQTHFIYNNNAMYEIR